jgi:predicted TPR repeat methyltransferase
MSLLKKMHIDGKPVGFIPYAKHLFGKFVLESTLVREKLKNLPHTNFELGKYHLEKENLSDAIMRFKMVAFLVPDHAEAHYYLGCAYILNENYNKAQEVLEKALQLQPDYPKASYMLQKLKDPSTVTVIPDAIITQRLHKHLPCDNYKATSIYERGRLVASKLLQLVEDKNPNFTLLDIECGNSVAPLVLLHDKDVIKSMDGISISAENVEKLSAFTVNDQKVFGLCEHVNYKKYLASKGSSYDIILVETAWKWFGDSDEIATLMAKKIKKKGFCVAIIPIGNVNQVERYRLNVQYDAFEYSESYITSQMESAGFKSIYKDDKNESESCNKLFIFQKK